MRPLPSEPVPSRLGPCRRSAPSRGGPDRRATGRLPPERHARTARSSADDRGRWAASGAALRRRSRWFWERRSRSVMWARLACRAHQHRFGSPAAGRHAAGRLRTPSQHLGASVDALGRRPADRFRKPASDITSGSRQQQGGSRRIQDWPSPSTQRLLDGAVVSVGSIELLLLLRSASDRHHDVMDLCAALQSPRAWAELELDRLAGARLIARAHDGWRYAPATRRLADAVDELSLAWQQDPRTVRRWVFASWRSPPP